jgi:hypothetical protein
MSKGSKEHIRIESEDSGVLVTPVDYEALLLTKLYHACAKAQNKNDLEGIAAIIETIKEKKYDINRIIELTEDVAIYKRDANGKIVTEKEVDSNGNKQDVPVVLTTEKRAIGKALPFFGLAYSEIAESNLSTKEIVKIRIAIAEKLSSIPNIEVNKSFINVLKFGDGTDENPYWEKIEVTNFLSILEKQKPLWRIISEKAADGMDKVASALGVSNEKITLALESNDSTTDLKKHSDLVNRQPTPPNLKTSKSRLGSSGSLSSFSRSLSRSQSFMKKPELSITGAEGDKLSSSVPQLAPRVHSRKRSISAVIKYAPQKQVEKKLDLNSSGSLVEENNSPSISSSNSNDDMIKSADFITTSKSIDGVKIEGSIPTMYPDSQSDISDSSGSESDDMIRLVDFISTYVNVINSAKIEGPIFKMRNDSQSDKSDSSGSKSDDKIENSRRTSWQKEFLVKASHKAPRQLTYKFRQIPDPSAQEPSDEKAKLSKSTSPDIRPRSSTSGAETRNFAEKAKTVRYKEKNFAEKLEQEWKDEKPAIAAKPEEKEPSSEDKKKANRVKAEIEKKYKGSQGISKK